MNCISMFHRAFFNSIIDEYQSTCVGIHQLFNDYSLAILVPTLMDKHNIKIYILLLAGA